MNRFVAALPALLAIGYLAQFDGAGGPRLAEAKSAVSAPQARARRPAPGRRRLRAHVSGRVMTPVLAPPPYVRPPPPPRADFTQRPVQVGQPPLPPYLQNNAPPVFEQQPIQ